MASGRSRGAARGGSDRVSWKGHTHTGAHRKVRATRLRHRDLFPLLLFSRLPPLLLLLCLTFLATRAESKPVRPDQAALLMQLKEEWKKSVDLSSWNPDKDCGTWGFRVRCAPDGSVT